jgi:hypothetical protein
MKKEKSLLGPNPTTTGPLTTPPTSPRVLLPDPRGRRVGREGQPHSHLVGRTRCGFGVGPTGQVYLFPRRS